jgi:hypothetical protein
MARGHANRTSRPNMAVTWSFSVGDRESWQTTHSSASSGPTRFYIALNEMVRGGVYVRLPTCFA